MKRGRLRLQPSGLERRTGEDDGKPVGTYLTLEVPDMASADDGYHREISETLAGFLEKYVENEETKNRNADNEKEHSKEKGCSILTVGLGNREVTPDALGPYVVDQLNITRHMVQEYGRYGVEEESRIVSAIVPGVMAQTGMETAEIVQGVVKETKPDMILVIDALAARSSKRLNRTIQISDAGIHPGAGVGNHRSVITKETMGIPVIAIGVPTVVDAATIEMTRWRILCGTGDVGEFERGRCCIARIQFCGKIRTGKKN